MRKQYVRQLHEHGNTCADMKCIAVYPASDVDARIAELEKKLHEATHCSFCGQPTYPVCTGNCDNDE